MSDAPRGPWIHEQVLLHWIECKWNRMDIGGLLCLATQQAVHSPGLESLQITHNEFGYVYLNIKISMTHRGMTHLSMTHYLSCPDFQIASYTCRILFSKFSNRSVA